MRLNGFVSYDDCYCIDFWSKLVLVIVITCLGSDIKLFTLLPFAYDFVIPRYDKCIFAKLSTASLTLLLHQKHKVLYHVDLFAQIAILLSIYILEDCTLRPFISVSKIHL